MERFYERYGRAKVYWCCFALLLALTVVINTLTYLGAVSVKYEGETLRRVLRTESGITMRDSSGNILELEVDAYDPFRYGGKMTYRGEVTGCAAGEDFSFVYTLPDGGSFEKDMFTVYYNGYEEPAPPPQVALFDEVLQLYSDNPGAGGLVGITLLSGLFLLLGLAVLIYTEQAWRINYYFTVKNGEPTEWALFSMRIGGVALVIMALLFYLIIMNAG